MKTLIKSGLIISHASRYFPDILIEDEKIVGIFSRSEGKRYERSADEVIDAKGMYVIPGAIDPHTHLEMPFMGTVSSDDFKTGTIAAACGGITSLIDFEIIPQGKGIDESFEQKHKLAGPKAVIDYSFHPCFVEFSEKVSKNMELAVHKHGTPSFKVFMTYSFRVDDYAFLKILEKAKSLGALVQLHAENHSILTFMNEKFEKEQKLSPIYHAKSRPNIAEEEAICRAAKLLKFAGSELYIVHLSSKEGLNEVKKAQKLGLKLYAETCPQYLILNESCYNEPNWGGAKYVMSPPIRDKDSNKALWEGIAKGNIQTIGSDHCPFCFNGGKDRFGKDDYKKIPNGGPGVETSLMLLHNDGVLKKRISLEKMVEVLSFNTAKIFGMKDKGEIAIGKDADIVVFDPKQKFTMSQKSLHMNVDYSIYEGKEITGMPKLVLSRGKKIARWNDNKVDFIGKLGSGKFIKRIR